MKMLLFRKKKFAMIAASLLLLTCGVSAEETAGGGERSSIRILDLVPEGCDPVRQLALQLALDEESGISDVQLERTDMTPDAAVAELKAGRVDFVLLAASQVSPDYRGPRRGVMREAGAIYVNGANSLKSLTLPEARALLLAERPVWEALNGSKADMQRIGVKFTRRSERETILRLLKLKRDDVAAEIFRLETTPEVVLLVGANPEAIGFGRLLAEYPVTVKALEIDGVAPTVDTVAEGKYPLQCEYVVLSRENPGASAAKFAAAFDTAAFAALVADNGFFPVRGNGKPAPEREGEGM